MTSLILLFFAIVFWLAAEIGDKELRGYREICAAIFYAAALVTPL